MTTPKSQSDSDLLLNGSSDSHKDKSPWQNEPVKIAPRGNSDSAQCSSTPVHSNEELGGMMLGHKIEVIRPNIIQRAENSLFTVITLPTVTSIPQILGETHTGVTTPQYRVASANGESTGFNFDESSRLPPGYYCLGLIFKSKEEVDAIVSLKLTLHIEPISNFTISQILFELYRSLGFEPSHLLGFPVRPSVPLTPFYRKTRSELGKLEERLVEKLTQVKPSTQVGPSDEIIKKLDQLEQKMVIPDQKAPIIDQTLLLERLDQLERKINPSDEIIKKLDQLEQKMVIPDQTLLLERLDQLERKMIIPDQKVPIIDQTLLLERLDQLEQKINPSDEIIKKLDQLEQKINPSDEIIKKLDQLEQKMVISDQAPLLEQKVPIMDQTPLLERLDQLEQKVPIMDQTPLLERLDQLEKKISPSDEIIKRLDQLEKKIVTPSPIIQKLEQLEKRLPSFDFESISKTQKLVIEKLGRMEQNLKEKDETIEEYQRHVISREQPEKGAHSISIDELETIISERNMYLEKLKEAEDYIDELISEQESIKIPDTSAPNFRLNSTKGGRK